MPTVTIDGQQPDGLLGVEDSQREGDTLGDATVRVVNNSTNRDLAQPGAEVVVTRDGTETFRGPVVGAPSQSDGVLRIDAQDARVEAKFDELHQVFYDVSRSEAVRRAVETRAQPLSRTEIHVGSELTDWESAGGDEILQLYDGARAGLYNWGTDLVFVGLPKGTSGTVTATYTDVGSRPIADGIYKLLTRVLTANSGGVLSLSVELAGPDGTTYVWDIDEPANGFNAYELPAEEATPDGQLAETGALQYRFEISGELSENRGIWIDNAHTIPFRLKDRSTGLSVAKVEPTNDSIIRRADERTSTFLNEMATEAEFDWWVEGDTLYFQPGASESTPREIVEGQTPVVSYDLDPEFDSVTNVVTVQGADDVEVTVSDGQSVDFYGVAARRRTVVDRTIQSEAEARERGQGILRDESGDDLSMTWTVADSDFATLSPANNIRVTWPPEGLDDRYAVTSVQGNDDGTVTVGLTGSSQSRL